MNVAEFKRLPFLGILRGIEANSIDPLVASVISSGLRTIEVTMNTQGAADLIQQMVKIRASRHIV